MGPDGTIDTVAGTGREGWSGDGGPATRADLGLPAHVALDPTGRYIAVPTLGNYIRRIDLETGRIQTVAGDGAQRTTGEGGPAAEASVESPHGAAYDADGNLYFPDGQALIRRVLADSGTIETVVEGPEAGSFKVLFAPDGTLYLISGDPSGGQIKRLGEDGSIEVVVGTGALGASRGRDARDRDRHSPERHRVRTRRGAPVQPVAAGTRRAPGRPGDRRRDDDSPLRADL